MVRQRVRQWRLGGMAINLRGQNPHQSCSGNCTGAATLVQAMVEGGLAINPKFGIMSLEAVEERENNTPSTATTTTATTTNCFSIFWCYWEFGSVTDLYISVTFNENSPPTDDPAYIRSLGAVFMKQWSKVISMLCGLCRRLHLL